jgi:hypothetical protein
LSESGLVLSLAEAYPELKDEEDKNYLDLLDLEITLIKSKTKSRTNRTSNVPIRDEDTVYHRGIFLIRQVVKLIDIFTLKKS